MSFFKMKNKAVFVKIDHIQNQRPATGGATPAITPTVFVWFQVYNVPKLGVASGFKQDPEQVLPVAVSKTYFDQNFEAFDPSQHLATVPATTLPGKKKLDEAQ